MKVKITYDSSEYKERIEKAIEHLNDSLGDLMRTAANWYASAAQKHTPPSVGKNSIEKKYYTRPILSLKKLIAGEYDKFSATDLDKIQLRSGKHFKVINDRDRRKSAYAYTKTLAEAKAVAKIKNRGLARVMWGKSLPEIGARIPNTIQALIRKSPNLGSMNYSTITMNVDNGNASVEIENKASGIERFGKMANAYGETNAEKAINAWMRRFAKENINL